jgi:predicted RNA-binding protein
MAGGQAKLNTLVRLTHLGDTMCESTVLLRTQDGTEELMSDVVSVRCDGPTVVVADIMGDKKTVRGVIESIDFLGHVLVIVPT